MNLLHRIFRRRHGEIANPEVERVLHQYQYRLEHGSIDPDPALHQAAFAAIDASPSKTWTHRISGNHPDDFSRVAAPDQPEPIRTLATLAITTSSLDGDTQTVLLTERLKDPSDPVRRKAASTLMCIGTLKALIAVASGKNHGHSIRSAAARQIATFGEKAVEAIPVLCDGLCRGDFTVGQTFGFADALVAIGKRSVDPLRAELRSGNDWTVGRAILVLSELGDLAADAKPDLLPLLNSASPEVQLKAAAAIWSACGTREGIPVIRKLIESRDVKIRIRAAIDLLGIEQDDQVRLMILNTIKNGRPKEKLAAMEELSPHFVLAHFAEFEQVLRPLTIHRKVSLREKARHVLEWAEECRTDRPITISN